MTNPLFIVSKNTAVKVWNNLFSHYKVRIRFLLIQIDQWL
jgi:hypothetical protein